MVAYRERGRKWPLRAVFSGLIALFLCSPSLAQPQGGTPEDRARYDLLFNRLLADPANLDANFAFAETATSLRDYEAAIGALERMLYYNPDLQRVRLELGLLYFRLGSYSMARTYFDAVLQDPSAPEDVRLRVQSFVTEIDRRLSTTQWSFSGSAGFRYQSNASAGPSSLVVRAIGFDALLDRRFSRQPDWNVFANGTVRHIFDFENQRGDVWESSLVLGYSHQFKIHRLSLGAFEFQTGPRLAVDPDNLPGMYIRPYAVTGFATLGGDPYLGTTGAGLAVGGNVGFAQIEPFIEFRRRSFRNSDDYQTATQQNGTLFAAGVTAGGPLIGALRWQTRVAYLNNDARDLYTFNSYDQGAADLLFAYDFAGPWGNRPWTATTFVGFSRSWYDAPNPIVDPRETREDREWRLGAGIDMPITDHVGLLTQVNYTYNDSNLPNYRTRNLAVTFGPSLRF